MSIFGYSKLTQDQARLFIINCYMGVLRRYPEKDILENESRQISLGKKTCSDFLSGIIYSKEFQSIGGSTDFLDLSKGHVELEFKNQGKSGKIKNIIYLGFSINRPIGGMKVIFHHAALINSFTDLEVNAGVFFPETTNFNITWLDTNIHIKRDHLFDAAEDFVVVPEVWALSYGQLLKRAGVRYGIFVQNGYLLFHELSGLDKSKLEQIKDVYHSADYILSISDDVTKCIKSIYPKSEANIVKLKASVDGDLFFSDKNKLNIITYMPRKLRSHSSWVVCYLLNKVPRNWEIIAIDNMTENQVAQALKASKIFMSFSEQEGLGLPPLEAAIAGNKVIGYTGQAGKEYWTGKIFHEIENGDLLDFAETVLDETKKLDKIDPCTLYPEFLKEIIDLKEKYSIQAEALALEKFIKQLTC